LPNRQKKPEISAISDRIVRFFYWLAFPLPQTDFSATAVNKTSVDEFKAVSQESCTTPTIKPMPTTSMAMSFEMPNKLQATGMSNKEPPATPEAPQAEMADTTLSKKAVG